MSSALAAGCCGATGATGATGAAATGFGFGFLLQFILKCPSNCARFLNFKFSPCMVSSQPEGVMRTQSILMLMLGRYLSWKWPGCWGSIANKYGMDPGLLVFKILSSPSTSSRSSLSRYLASNFLEVTSTTSSFMGSTNLATISSKSP